MKTTVTILILIIASNTYSQNLLYEGYEIGYMHTDLDEFTTKFSDFEILPNKIKTKINSLVKNQLGENSNKISFKYGLLIDLNSYFNEYPNKLNRYNTLIPSYVFHYIFSDSTAGIKYHEFTVATDNFGQIISLDFPNKYGFESYNLMPLDFAVKKADSIVNKKQFEFDYQYYDLIYDSSRNELIWNINYSKTQLTEDNLDLTYYIDFAFSTKDFELINYKCDTTKQTEPEIPIQEEKIPIIKSNEK